MTRGPDRRAAAALVALVAAGVGAAPASAGETLGFPGNQVGSGGQSCTGGQTFFQIQGASSNYVAPYNGVLTSWHVGTGVPSGVKLKVGRPAVGGLTIVAEDGPRTFPSSSGPTFAVRIPISQGDTIGLYMSSNVYCPVLDSGNSNDVLGVAASDPPLGTTATVTQNSFPTGRVPVEAKLEPDADNDGYGDETQDLCPTDASTPGGPCPPDRLAPDTSITKGPKRKTTSKQVTFEFSSTEPGSSFECSLDSGGFSPCTSPAKLKVKKTGKHNFLVRARDAAGNLDTTEASWSWKRVKKKPKKK